MTTNLTVDNPFTGDVACTVPLADDAIVGRVYALSEVLYAGAAGVGALIAPSLISTLGVDGSLAAVGIAFGAGAIVAQRTFARLDYGHYLFRKAFLLAPGRLNAHAPIADFQHRFRLLALAIAHGDAV